MVSIPKPCRLDNRIDPKLLIEKAQRADLDSPRDALSEMFLDSNNSRCEHLWIRARSSNHVSSTKRLSLSPIYAPSTKRTRWWASPERVAESIEHSLRTGEPIDVECRVRTASGEWRWIHSRGAPRRDKDGKIIRWYGSADDIQTQKQLEEELRRRGGEDRFPPA